MIRNKNDAAESKMEGAIANPVYCDTENIVSNSSLSKKQTGMYCSLGRLVASLIGVALLCTAIGLMCYYIPENDCPEVECDGPTFDTCWEIVKQHNECK